MKRVFDLLFSLFGIFFFAPLGLLSALLIKLSSKGPLFYPSERVGKGGKLFRCWKFRTMYVGADQKLEQILSASPDLRFEWNLYCKLKKDPRVTKLGRILRKSSLDELPQFWNVLKGDLSVVGPRPFTEQEIQLYLSPSRAEKILSIRPGLTGSWQTSDRNLLPFHQRIFLEETYVNTRSWLLDISLICKTIPKIFFPKGAF